MPKNPVKSWGGYDCEACGGICESIKHPGQGCRGATGDPGVTPYQQHMALRQTVGHLANMPPTLPENTVTCNRCSKRVIVHLHKLYNLVPSKALIYSNETGYWNVRDIHPEHNCS